MRGFIFADEKPDLSKNVESTDIAIALIRPDGDRRVWLSGKATFFLHKTAYFKIDNVPPGHYLAYLSVPARGWSSRKVEVDVTTHMKFISLDLVHKNSRANQEQGGWNG